MDDDHGPRSIGQSRSEPSEFVGADPGEVVNATVDQSGDLLGHGGGAGGCGEGAGGHTRVTVGGAVVFPTNLEYGPGADDAWQEWR